jgi:hypothetical protein
VTTTDTGRPTPQGTTPQGTTPQGTTPQGATSQGAPRPTTGLHPQIVGLRDLDAIIVAQLRRLPELDLVVAADGDIVAASLVALYRQARFAPGPDRCSGAGARLGRPEAADTAPRGRTLLMYGVCDGARPPEAHDDLTDAFHGSPPPLRGAVLAGEQAAQQLDVVLQRTSRPVVTTWQLPTSPWLARAAVTLEGVLAGRRSRGSRRADLAPAVPTLRPATDIGVVLSERPERERDRTAAWLHEHGIGYRHLAMLGGPRTPRGLAAAKARQYRRHGVQIAIDADARSASRTATAAGRAVLAWDVQRTVSPERGDACR